MRNTNICTMVIAALLLAIPSQAGQGRLPAPDVPYSVAHRGCHIDGLVPENCPFGVEWAARYGYRAVECDVHYTKDSVLVLMHDRTINRTMRLRDGYAEIPEPVKYADVDFAELRDKYVLASSDPNYRTPITSFDEELEACKRYGIIPMLHSPETEAYRRAQEVLGDNFIAFEENYAALLKAREISDCLILWDPGRASAEEVIEKLRAIGGRCGVSSMKRDLLTPEFVHAIRAAGFEVQSSIFPTPHDMTAVASGCSIILSDFSLFPAKDSPVREQGEDKGIVDRALRAGEEILLEWPVKEAFSIELSIGCSGSAEVIIGGKKYPIGGEDVNRLIGRRFFNEAPAVRIVAKEDTRINYLLVNVFTY